MKESIVMQMLRNDCKLAGVDPDNAYKKTNILLRLYRKINWCLDRRFDELNEITYEKCFGDKETLSYLLNFAPDSELAVFRKRAVTAMQNKVLIELIDKAVTKMKDYPVHGETYYSIFDLKYFNRGNYSELDILDILDMERSTFYRKKKEATYLLGYILFGFIMPDYVKS